MNAHFNYYIPVLGGKEVQTLFLQLSCKVGLIFLCPLLREIYGFKSILK